MSMTPASPFGGFTTILADGKVIDTRHMLNGYPDHVEVVPSPDNQNNSVFRFMLHSNDDYFSQWGTNCYKSELTGPTQFLGKMMVDIDIMLSGDWSLANEATMMCLHAPSPESGELNVKRGSIQLTRTDKGSLRLDVIGDTNIVSTTIAKWRMYDCGKLSMDIWNKYRFKMNVSFNTDGYVELYQVQSDLTWKLLTSDYGPNAYNDTALPYWKLGLYHWQAWKETKYVRRIMYSTGINVINL